MVPGLARMVASLDAAADSRDMLVLQDALDFPVALAFGIPEPRVDMREWQNPAWGDLPWPCIPGFELPTAVLELPNSALPSTGLNTSPLMPLTHGDEMADATGDVTHGSAGLSEIHIQDGQVIPIHL